MIKTTPEIDKIYSTLCQLVDTCNFHDQDAEIKLQLILGCKLDKVRDKGPQETRHDSATTPPIWQESGDYNCSL